MWDVILNSVIMDISDGLARKRPVVRSDGGAQVAIV